MASGVLHLFLRIIFKATRIIHTNIRSIKQLCMFAEVEFVRCLELTLSRCDRSGTAYYEELVYSC